MIPALNEARNLAAILPTLPPVHEVILVDGGSHDGTVEVAQQLLPSIRVCQQTRRGKGNALAVGFAQVTGDVVVMFDADGSADAAEIERFVEALLDGADFAKGTRFAPGGGSADITTFRKLGNDALNLHANLLFGTDFTDLCYGFNAFWSDIMEVLALPDPNLPALPDGAMRWGDGFEVETLINCRAAAAGLVIAEVPSVELERIHGLSNLKAVRDGFRVLRTMHAERVRATRHGRLDAVMTARTRQARPHGCDQPRVPSPRRHAVDRRHQQPTPPQPRPATCSVVIPAHDARRLSLLERAVTSARRQVGPHVASVEVVVAIDNNPELHAIATARFPEARVVLNGGPRGASATRNAGANASNGAVLAFLDDDAEAEPGWLEHLVVPLLRDPGIVGVGGWIEASWQDHRPSWFPMEFGWVVGASHAGQPRRPHVVRNVWSENMAVRALDFRSVGGFRVDFGKVDAVSRPEDTELCLRLSAATGGQWWVEPQAVVRHHVPTDRATIGFFLARCLSEGRGKAGLSEIASVETALATERDYVRSVLPRAVAQGLADLLRGRLAGLLRSVAIVLGLVMATVGYGEARLSRRAAMPALPDAADADTPATHATGMPTITGPVRMLTVDLSGTLPDIGVGDADEPADVLVTARLCERPVGMLVVRAPVSAGQLADRIEIELGPLIAAEARSHGILAGRLTETGLPHAHCPVVDQRGHIARHGPGITVIICTRDRAEQLRRCLLSVIDLDYDNMQIVVVDNAPSDDSAEKVCRDLDSPHAPIDYVAEPLPGLSRARNTGLRATLHPIVAFVDDDEVVDPHWLSALAVEFADPEVAAVTGLVLPAELRTMAQVRFEQVGGHSKGRGFGRVVMDRGYQRSVQSPVYPRPTFGAGANMAFRLRHLIDIGGFDVSLGAGTSLGGGEDTLALTEVMLAGATLVYTPAALTRHFHRDDEQALAEQLTAYRVGLGGYYAALLGRGPTRLTRVTRTGGQLAARALRQRLRPAAPIGTDALPGESRLARDLARGAALYLAESWRGRRALRR